MALITLLFNYMFNYMEGFLAPLVLNYYISLKHGVTRHPIITGWNLVPCLCLAFIVNLLLSNRVLLQLY